MKLRSNIKNPSVSHLGQVGTGGIVLLEVFVATLFVVGLFDATCQPLGWQTAIQYVLCAALGPALWLADRQLQRLTSAEDGGPAIRGGHCP